MQPFDPTTMKKRSNIFLLVLCILVFVDAGSSFFQMLFMPLYANGDHAEMALNIYKKMGADETVKQMEQIFSAAQAMPSWYFFLSAIPFAVAICGAAFVLKKKTIGFHLYVISQIFAFICQNFLLKEPFNMSWISIFCSICIAVCFYFQLKNEEKRNIDTDETDDYQ